MQITLSKQNTVERVVRDVTGRLVRATFCVYEQAGRMRVRLLSCEYIPESVSLSSAIHTLFGYASFVQNKFSHTHIVSPFFNKADRIAFHSQPRAPTM